jgi:hypothetical protein
VLRGKGGKGGALRSGLLCVPLMAFSFCFFSCLPCWPWWGFALSLLSGMGRLWQQLFSLSLSLCVWLHCIWADGTKEDASSAAIQKRWCESCCAEHSDGISGHCRMLSSNQLLLLLPLPLLCWSFYGWASGTNLLLVLHASLFLLLCLQFITCAFRSESPPFFDRPCRR